MIMENHHDVLIAVGEPAELRLVELINTLQSACADAKCQRDQV